MCFETRHRELRSESCTDELSSEMGCIDVLLFVLRLGFTIQRFKSGFEWYVLLCVAMRLFLSRRYEEAVILHGGASYGGTAYPKAFAFPVVFSRGGMYEGLGESIDCRVTLLVLAELATTALLDSKIKIGFALSPLGLEQEVVLEMGSLENGFSLKGSVSCNILSRPPSDDDDDGTRAFRVPRKISDSLKESGQD
ncbi:hypothetical protein Tco_1517298 [Tanacetum coccineum]